MKHELESYLPMRKACAIPGVVPLTLRRWEKIGEIQCIRTPSGQRRYARREILRLLGENLPGGTRAVLYARESSAKQAGMESYGLAVHQAATLVIARRALDYKEKVPRNVRKVVAATEAGSHLKGWGKLFGMLKHTRQSAIRERAYKGLGPGRLSGLRHAPAKGETRRGVEEVVIFLSLSRWLRSRRSTCNGQP